MIGCLGFMFLGGMFGAFGVHICLAGCLGRTVMGLGVLGDRLLEHAHSTGISGACLPPPLGSPSIRLD